MKVSEEFSATFIPKLVEECGGDPNCLVAYCLALMQATLEKVLGGDSVEAAAVLAEVGKRWEEKVRQQYLN